MANVDLLISRYLDGDLADDEVAELAAALGTDVASIDQLVFMSLIHAQLLNWMDQHGDVRESAASFVGESSSLGYTSSARSSALPSDKKTHSRSEAFTLGSRRRFFSFAAIAAMLLVAASISIGAYLLWMRPVHIGQLTDTTDCRWGSAAAEMGVGTFVSTGQDLEPLEGRAVITFATGAKLLLEGPTSLHLESASNVRLLDGRVAAKVPRHAVGFMVTSSLARVVDLGTQFSLDLSADKSFDLHVFEGLVELQLDKRFGEAVHKPAYVSAIHAVTFDVRAGDIKAIEFEPGRKMPF